jgi:acyl-coenzyme A synthetase/AMP-(fatty) acid ligase
MLILFTSGTTGKPKLVRLTHEDLIKSSGLLLHYTNLKKNDLILNVFPTYTVAHWVFCVYHQKLSGCKIINPQFKPKEFWNIVYEFKPTFIPLAIRTIRTLFKLNVPNLDWGPQFLTGSDKVFQQDIDMIKGKGASCVWNVYGSTEYPPPIFISKDKVNFNFEDFKNYYHDIKFTEDGQLKIDNNLTNDFFDLDSGEFLFRGDEMTGRTWKSM